MARSGQRDPLEQMSASDPYRPAKSPCFSKYPEPCHIPVSTCKIPWGCTSMRRDPLSSEPLDQVTRAIQERTEADRILAIAFRRYVCPRALANGERPYPIRVISPICQQHGSRTQSGQEHRTEPIVLYLTSREAKAHGQAIGVYNCVKLAGESAS